MSGATLPLALLVVLLPLAGMLGVYLSRLHFPSCHTCGRVITRYNFNGNCSMSCEDKGEPWTTW